MTRSRSLPRSHGISSVNIVTHCFHEHGIRVMREVATALEDISKVESPPKQMGKRMTMLLAHR